MELTFNTAALFWGCCGSIEITKLQKLPNSAAWVIKNSTFDAFSRSTVQGLRWKTIEEHINEKTKTMAFKSLHKLAT